MSETPSWSYLIPSELFSAALDQAYSYLESSFDPTWTFSYGDSESSTTIDFNSSRTQEINLRDGTTIRHRSYKSLHDSVECGIWLDLVHESYFGDHFWGKTPEQSKFLLELDIYLTEGNDYSEATVDYYDRGLVFFDNARDENLKGFHNSLFQPAAVATYAHAGTYMRKPTSRELEQDYYDLVNESDPTPDQLAKFFGVS